MKRILPIVAALSLYAGLAVAQVGGVPGVSGPPTLTQNNPNLTGDIDASAGVFAGAIPICLEGFTANNFETCFAVTDPTADRTLTLPNADGTVVLSTLATNAPEIVNSVWDASNAVVFEGTADNFETSITATDPTADRAITVPDASGTVMLSTLATNAPEAAGSVWAVADNLVFEGGVADGFETELTVATMTQDAQITLPDENGTIPLIGQFDHPIADSGGAGAATYTYQPTPGVAIATFDCLDADGCDLHIGEATSLPGMRLIVTQTAATAGNITLKNDATVCNLDAAGDQVLTVGGTVELAYIASTWVQVAIFFDLS